MDIVEFQRLNARVVATRNSETRAFLRAFDQAPGGSLGVVGANLRQLAGMESRQRCAAGCSLENSGSTPKRIRTADLNLERVVS